MEMTIKMSMKILVLLVMVTLIPIVSSKVKRYPKNQTNSLSKARCDLACFDVNREERNECRSDCRAHEKKPGTCPKSDIPGWETACLKTCDNDPQCDGTQKCCHHNCGSACSEPLDLLTLPGLSAIPVINKVKEKKKSVQIHWSDGVGDAARAVTGRKYYLVEEQHHLGPKYEAARLGQWNSLLRTNKTKASLRNLLKPGRWYRFRVAAVTTSGSRGFSNASAPFTLRKQPRPPPVPKKLKVRHVKTENGTITIKLEWKEPVSDLPIIKYKVYWSRRARGVNGELDSVLVNHQTVPKDQTWIEIKDLQPNSLYFLQVQSISQYGTGKLRSFKQAIFYNTTSANFIHPSQTTSQNSTSEDLKKEEEEDDNSIDNPPKVALKKTEEKNKNRKASENPPPEDLKKEEDEEEDDNSIDNPLKVALKKKEKRNKNLKASENPPPEDLKKEEDEAEDDNSIDNPPKVALKKKEKRNKNVKATLPPEALKKTEEKSKNRKDNPPKVALKKKEKKNKNRKASENPPPEALKKEEDEDEMENPPKVALEKKEKKNKNRKATPPPEALKKTEEKNKNRKETPRPEALKKKEEKQEDKGVKGLKLLKIIWNNHKLKARISWDPLPGNHTQYYVQWQTVNCSDPKIPKKYWNAKVKQESFDIYELNYRCNYLVNVNRSWQAKTNDSELFVNVPRCEYFQRKLKNIPKLSICETNKTKT